MQKIIPHLWFDKEAKEASEFYCSIFPDSQVKHLTTLKDTPSGDAEVVTFELFGTLFQAISAGPYFKFNPSHSFTVTCSTPEEAQNYYDKLAPGGKVMMPLQEYPWSQKYAWIGDKYGLSWQINTEKGAGKIIPTLMFTAENFGKLDEALEYYKSVFKNSSVEGIARYEKGENDVEGKIKHTSFVIEGQPFRAMESSYEHGFTFNEAVSFIINCKDQAEIDYYWEKLSAVTESEQCGWLKDRYGLSWQVVPEMMNQMMEKGTPEQIKKLTEAFLKMKKFDIETLKKAAGE